jgi:hypothetical protein
MIVVEKDASSNVVNSAIARLLEEVPAHLYEVVEVLRLCVSDRGAI